MLNSRYNVIASSLASYMGVGFNTIQEQLDYDLGKEERVVDDEAQDRMDLGNAMEDGCLNYFEKKMGILIDERNSEYKYACDGKLKCKRDGRTFLDGIETGVENKYKVERISKSIEKDRFSALEYALYRIKYYEDKEIFKKRKKNIGSYAFFSPKSRR
jgi:hypothetical protein